MKCSKINNLSVFWMLTSWPLHGNTCIADISSLFCGCLCALLCEHTMKVQDKSSLHVALLCHFLFEQRDGRKERVFSRTPGGKIGWRSLSLSSALEIFLSTNLLHVPIALLGGVILPQGGLGMDMHPYHPGGGKDKHSHSSIGAYWYHLTAKNNGLNRYFYPVIISKHP